MDLGLDDTAALVTASSSGLGKASAVALAREGADVAICARNAERLETARREVNEAGSGDVLAVQADVTDPDEIDALLEEVTGDFGGLDHLVTSAGTPTTKPFLETTERDWYVSYDLLVMCVVWLARGVHPFLVESETGSVTVIASTDAREPVENRVLSSALRRAVLGLVKTLAREWAPAVRVNAVLPGPHRTPSLERRIQAAVDRGAYETDADGLEAVERAVPLGRVGDPDAFGDVVAVLASERAGFVTGTAIPVDGGLLRS